MLHLLVTLITVSNALDLSADSCASGHSSSMCEEFGYPHAEIWQSDADCCACQGRGRCAAGYVMAEAIMEGSCHTPAANTDCQVRTTCCTPASPENDRRNYVRAPMIASSWNAASEYCTDNYAGLAVIDSSEENHRAKEACGVNSALFARQLVPAPSTYDSRT